MKGLIMRSTDASSIQRVEAQDVATLTDICERAFHSDAEVGAGGGGGPSGYDSIEWNS